MSGIASLEAGGSWDPVLTSRLTSSGLAQGCEEGGEEDREEDEGAEDEGEARDRGAFFLLQLPIAEDCWVGVASV